MRKFKINREGPLLKMLFSLLTDTKKTKVRQYLKFGSVQVNDRIEKRFDRVLKAGDTVCVLSAKEAVAEGSLKFGIRIVYEDKWLLVIDKPSGLLTISTKKVFTRTAFYAANEHALYTLRGGFPQAKQTHSYTIKRGKQIFLVHRLDKEVSGLLIFAKAAFVKESLQTNWTEVTKRYYAVVEGCPEKTEDTLKSYLCENKFLKVYSTLRSEGAKFSVTHYRVLRSSPNYALLEVELGTGRKHQIRVQLADMGNPIAGDKQYGAKTDPAKRIMLHAYYLVFVHPVTGKETEIFSELPSAFDRVLSSDK